MTRHDGTLRTAVGSPIETPRRIQRKRTKGWRMPEGAVYVGNPSKWWYPYVCLGWDDGPEARYRRHLLRILDSGLADPDWWGPLRGRDLACWCPLDQPCHADVLLDLANAALTPKGDTP